MLKEDNSYRYPNLIIFEGADGCGKSTQIELLKKHLEKNNQLIKLTREPGGTDIGKDIRELILHSKHKIDPVTEAYLYAADRAAHNLEIMKWISEGYIVLCDRHLLSSIVLQENAPAEKINSVAMLPLFRKSIDTEILYFDINHETFRKRSDERLASRGLDNIESRYVNEDATKSMLENYAIEASNMNAIFIDADKSIDDVFKNVLESLKL